MAVAEIYTESRGHTYTLECFAATSLITGGGGVPYGFSFISAVEYNFRHQTYILCVEICIAFSRSSHLIPIHTEQARSYRVWAQPSFCWSIYYLVSDQMVA